MGKQDGEFALREELTKAKAEVERLKLYEGEYLAEVEQGKVLVARLDAANKVIAEKDATIAAKNIVIADLQKRWDDLPDNCPLEDACRQDAIDNYEPEPRDEP